MIVRYLRRLDPGLRLLMVTTFLAFVAMALTALCGGCSSARAESPVDFVCHPIDIHDRVAIECKKADAHCFLIDDKFSCFKP